MGDGARIVGIFLGVGVTAALVHRALRPALRSEAPRLEPPITRPPVPAVFPVAWSPIPMAAAPQQPPRPVSATMTKIQINENAWQILQWQPAVSAEMILHGIPAAFGMAWLAVESGGNPCAVGESTATGPDGNPREVGLFQIYNPDDFKAIGGTAAEICAYCARPLPGARQHKTDDGGYRDGTLANPQRQTISLLSPQQVGRQAELGRKLIELKRRYADHYLAASGIKWSVDGPDYWAAVKAPHAYPPIINTGLAQVARHLGRAPLSWREFRATYEAIEPRARFNPAVTQQSPYFRGLENAEWTGFHVQPARTVS